MKYCKYCGSEMNDKDSFCGNCGRKTNRDDETTFYCKLWCSLAYWGFLFWLPLIACPKYRFARISANCGLWVLIVSTPLAFGINMMQRIINYGFAYKLIYVFALIVFIGFMAHMTWGCIKSIMAICRGTEAPSVMFFTKIRIIKDKRS